MTTDSAKFVDIEKLQDQDLIWRETMRQLDERLNINESELAAARAEKKKFEEAMLWNPDRRTDFEENYANAKQAVENLEAESKELREALRKAAKTLQKASFELTEAKEDTQKSGKPEVGTGN